MWRSIRLLLLACGLLTTSVFAEWGPGSNLPDLKKVGLEGNLPDIEGKVVLVDFWASWCVPCKASFPAIDELYEKYKDKGFRVIAISADENKKAFARFVDRMRPRFPIVRSGTRTFMDSVKPPAMPTSFLVDKNGEIRFMHVGWNGNRTRSELEAQIVELLEE